MKTRYEAQYQQLLHAVLNSPGDTAPSLRHAIQEQAARLSGSTSREEKAAPTELSGYIRLLEHGYL